MGVYSYECPNGHVTEKLVSLAERTKTVKCEHDGCEFVASYVISPVATTFRANDRKAFKRGGR